MSVSMANLSDLTIRRVYLFISSVLLNYRFVKGYLLLLLFIFQIFVTNI